MPLFAAADERERTIQPEIIEPAVELVADDRGP